MRGLIRAALVCLAVISSVVWADEEGQVTQADATAVEHEVDPVDNDVQKVIDNLDKPLYSPFIERYVLDELRSLRVDLSSLRAELTEKIVERDLSIGDRAMSYSANTVTYFFYMIAAVSSVLVIVGWTSIREIKDKVSSMADKEVQKLVDVYEKRLRSIEAQLTQKTRHIDENRQQIEKTQEVHSLWLRAAQEHGEHAKIAIYDEILKLRPQDCEALTYKADTVLELGEPQWAKNLCLQALDIDNEYVHAHYQLACANVALGQYEDAVVGLKRALQLNDSILGDIKVDKALDQLRERPEFRELIEPSVS